MNLTKEIQKHLMSVSSKLELATTIDGEMPSKYAFYKPKRKRSFRTELRKEEAGYSLVLFEVGNGRDYEFCYFRSVLDSLERLTNILIDWVENELSVTEIYEKYENLEKFKDYEYAHSNIEIEEKWLKVKNMAFNDLKFWQKLDFHKRYEIMLSTAKKRKEFEKFYPFTSHYWLRFSLDIKNQETWVLDLNIVPVCESENGEYLVNIPEKVNNQFYFNDIEKALDFYSQKLTEYKPVKWV